METKKTKEKNMIRRRPFMRRNRSEEDTWYRIKDRINDVIDSLEDLEDDAKAQWIEDLKAISKEVNTKLIKALNESKKGEL